MQEKRAGAPNATPQGWTLIELLITVTVLLIVAIIVIPEVLEARKNSKALAAGAALSQIEAAKSAWKRDYPGAAIPNAEALNRYFPGEGVPEDPWEVGFNNVTSLTLEASHPYNNNATYEPRNQDPSVWATNGHNDPAKPSN